MYDGLPLKVKKIEEFVDFKGTGQNLIIVDLLNPEPYVQPPEPKRFRGSAATQGQGSGGADIGLH